MFQGPNSNIVIDSRLVSPGDTFVATRSAGSFFYRGRTERDDSYPYEFDSHPYIADAISRGATHIVYSDARYEPSNTNISKLLVDDGIQYLVDELTKIIEKTSKHIVGISGSTGKSITCELVNFALGKNKTYKHPTDRPTPISIPLYALNSQSFYEADYFIVEMPMDWIGQITELCQVVPPHIGVLTNINSSHIKQLGSIDDIVVAKMELVWQALANQGSVILNGDDPYLHIQAGNLIRRKSRIQTFGRNIQNDIRILSSSWNGTGYNYTVANYGRIRQIETRLIGKSLAYPIAASVAVAMSLGTSFSDAVENLYAANTLPGRMCALTGKLGEMVIDDTKVCTPQSSIELLKTVLEVPLNRKILIQGPITREQQHGQPSTELLKLMNEFDDVVLYMNGEWLKYENGFPTIVSEKALMDWYSCNVSTGDLVVFNGSDDSQMCNLVSELVIRTE